MRTSERESPGSTGVLRVAKKVERHLGSDKETSVIAHEADLQAQVTCRLGDDSCASAHASTLERGVASRTRQDHGSILRLQQQYGNRYVQRVVAMARQPEDSGEVHPEVERDIQLARGGGQSLDGRAREEMESAFGTDFREVRIHTDAKAHQLNEELGAKAFATGRDIFFRRGHYSPASSSGRELLAHELTHVVQQRGSAVRSRLELRPADDPLEREADLLAEAALQHRLPETAIQRKCLACERLDNIEASTSSPSSLRECSVSPVPFHCPEFSQVEEAALECPSLPDPVGEWAQEQWLCEMRREPVGSNRRLLAIGAEGLSVKLLHQVLQNWICNPAAERFARHRLLNPSSDFYSEATRPKTSA